MNASFRTNDIETIFHSRFVVREIWQELKKRQANADITVYRGQLMSNAEVELFRKSVGKLISMKSFLSTTLNDQLAKVFAGFDSNDTSKDLASILFVIKADPKQSNQNMRPFGDIGDISQFGGSEKEILFMMGSVVRIIDVKQDDNKNWTVSMSLCNQEDIELYRLFCWLKTDQHRNEIDDSPEYNFVDLLLAMEMPNEAYKFCWKLLLKYRSHSPQNNQLAKCYYMLGRTMLLLGSPPSTNSLYLKKSLSYFGKALSNINETTTNCCVLRRNVHHSRGNVYRTLSEFKKALNAYIIAMVYYSESIGMQHRLTANLYVDLGQTYFEKQDLCGALFYYKRAQDVASKTLHDTHPDMGIFHMRLVTVYAAMDEKDQFNALNIDLTSLLNGISPLLQTCAILSIIYAYKDSINTFETKKNIMHGDETIEYPDIKPIWSSEPKIIEYSCPWCSNEIWIYRQVDFLKGCPCFRCLNTIIQSRVTDSKMAVLLRFYIYIYGH